MKRGAFFCCIKEHKEHIEQLCDDTIKVLLDAGIMLSNERNTVKRSSVQWDNNLQDLKRQSIDIHDLWKSMGRPRYGVINNERIRVKCLYKRYIKEQKHVFNERCKNKLVEKLINGESSAFWKGWKSVFRKNEYKANMPAISGVCDTKAVCDGFINEFAQNFIDSWDGDLCDKVDNLCNDLVKMNANEQCTSFTRGDIIIAIGKLKCNKSAGLDDLYAEHVKYAHPLIIDLLMMLFNNCCKHGYVPVNFCGGRITPIPKKSCSTAFHDYRPVTSINVIPKIFEYCILQKMEEFIDIDELQFGFTKGGGCEQALFIAKSVIEYYMEYGSNVYIASLDLSKAYDRVHHCKLWLKLFDLNIPYDILLLFAYWFRHLFCFVVWRGCKSDVLFMKSGVRQGGVISCLLFNIYINDLICILKNSGNGCYMSGLFMGCIFYADDVLLLSGSVIKLQKLLDLCNDYANEFSLVFNNKKSWSMMYGKEYEYDMKKVQFAGDYIEWVSEGVYLGVKLIAGKCFKTDVGERKRKFFAVFNNVIANGGFLSEECLMEIYNKQCIPILMYGAAVWSISTEEKRKVGVCLNRGVRRIFNYNDYESVKDICFGFHMLPADLYITRASLLLCGSALRSNRNVLVKCAMWQRD